MLSEDQVGLNPITGKLKINPEVLEDLRRYLVANNGDDISVKKDRVRSTIAQVEKDPYAQKVVLRLEKAPLVSRDGNKGKGIVFGFESADKAKEMVSESKFMEGSLLAGKLSSRIFGPEDLRTRLDSLKEQKVARAGGFTAYGSVSSEAGPSGATSIAGPSEVGPSGTVNLKEKSRKRQVKRLRKLQIKKEGALGPVSEIKKNGKGVIGPKRKLQIVTANATNKARRKNQLMVPKEGPSNP